MNYDFLIGYISLIDFGVSKKLDEGREKTYSVRGTPEYLAPEILGSKGHSYPVDWWALGTVAYEMLTGTPPFYKEDQKKMFKDIKSKAVSFPKKIPMSDICKDFIS